MPVWPAASDASAAAVTVMFAVNGMLLGGYGGSLPSLRDKLGIDATQIAIMLFFGGAGRDLVDADRRPARRRDRRPAGHPRRRCRS